MTPFMLQVESVRDGRSQVGPPDLVSSRTRTVAEGADRHVLVRALAEQLVAEANAVLGPSSLGIVDHPGLSFSLTYGSRTVTVETALREAAATAYLDGRAVELADPESVADLVLHLIAGPASAGRRNQRP